MFLLLPAGIYGIALLVEIFGAIVGIVLLVAIFGAVFLGPSKR